MAKTKQICEEKLGPVIESLGYELVEVRYIKENGEMSLIFTIDKDDGIDFDDCEKVSNALNPILDEINPTGDEPYTLVVSSPGLDRPLKTDRDFKRNIGKEVDITLFAKIDGKKSFNGILKSFDEKTVTISSGDTQHTFERDKIGSMKLVIKF